MSTLRRLALVTTIATYLLISVGALVRASGAGLGCPDWPRCYGRWVPPTDAAQVPLEQRAEFNVVKCWTEYLNRLVGVGIGFLVLGTAVAAILVWRRSRQQPQGDSRRPARLAQLATASLLLVGFQGWLGGKVVTLELDPRLVSIHFLVAVVIVWLLSYLCLQSLSSRFPQQRELDPASRRLRRWTLLGLAVTTAQMLMGTLVRGGVDIEADARPDDPRESWLDAVGWTDTLHRDGAIAVLALVVVLFVLARRCWSGRGWLRRVVLFNLAVATGQIVAGLVLAYASLPPVAQIVHVSLGTWLVGGLHLQWLLSVRSEETAPLVASTEVVV